MGTRLFCGGLAWATDDASLRAAFESFGVITDARVVLDRETGRSRGFGFVSFADEAAAQAAVAAMDGANVDGRSIRVNEAQERGGPRGPRPPRRDGPGGGPAVTTRRPPRGPGPGGGYGGGPRRSPPPPRLPPAPQEGDEPLGKPQGRRQRGAPHRERVDPRDQTWGDGAGKKRRGGRGWTGGPRHSEGPPTKKKKGRKKSRPESAWESWEDDFDL